MENSSRIVRNRYILFIVSVALTLIGQQAIVQYDLDLQNSDAEIINTSGRQRMLSQRISKLALFIHYNIDKHKRSTIYNIDSLQKMVNTWESVHYRLIQHNKDVQESEAIDSLFNVNTPYLQKMVTAGRRIINNLQSDSIERSIEQIAEVEIPFLMTMEKIVFTYQREAEEKLNTLKKLELFLGAIALLILSAESIFIIYPVLRDLDRNNKQLQRNNADLVSSEEEIRNNLEQISLLQNDLEIKQKQYQGLIDDATDMIYELSQEGKFSFVNPVLVSITGYDRAKLIGKPYWELIHPDDRQSVVAFYDKQRKNLQETSYLEFRILTNRNEQIWVGQNVRMFFNERRTYKVSVVARDIHQIKEAEQALSEERILLRTIIDNIPLNVYAKNQRFEKILANKAEYEFAGGKSEKDVLGKTDIDLYPETSAQTANLEDQKILDGEPLLNVERLIERKDGTKTWFLISKVPLKNAKGETTGIVGISNDITSQKAAQDELSKSEKLYRLLSENSKDVISLHKIDGTFEYISPACIHLHGYTPEELVGKNGLEFMHPDDGKAQLDQVPELMDKMMRKQDIEPMQFRIASKHRGFVWAENVIKPVFEKNELVGFQSTVRDISVRKAFESQLQEAKKRAEDATNAKSQFLSMMSHEIRTPINGIIGLTHHLLEESPRPDQLESLKLIEFSGENLMTIINDILDFGKIEANKIVFEKVDFNLYDELKNIVRLMEFRAINRPILVNLNYTEGVPHWVKSDPVRIGQIITNLMGNAMKFTAQGEVTLVVDLVRKQGANLQFDFQIKDTGIGISADKLETIFESFSQATDDTTRKFGGTGLGLTITKHLVQLMGGAIKVESKTGVGTTFHFTLDLEEGNALQPSDRAGEKLSIPNITVLLVEDDKVNQLVAANFLKKWGVNVVVANNGIEAVDLVKSKKFQLVFMDLNMPLMDGYEATRQIRNMNDSYFQQVPIIALTADAVGGVKDKIIDSGMNALLNKPFRPAELRNIIGDFTAMGLGNRNPSTSTDDTFATALDLYTEGNDAFKKEFVQLLIKNFLELQTEFKQSLTNNSNEAFRKAVHKCTTAIKMLADSKFEKIVERAKEILESTHDYGHVPGLFIKEFDSEIERVVRKLEKS
jgi:PAS domain S-box-containing protein